MSGKRDWTQTAALVLCTVLLVLSFGQRRRFSDLEQDVWNAQNSIMDEVSRLEGQMASLRSDLKSADDLVRDWSYTPVVNQEKRGLDVDVTVKLKEWQKDTTLELLWTSLGITDSKGSLPLVYDGTGGFTGKLEIPLNSEIILEAAIQNGDIRRQESLGSLGDTSVLLPVRCESSGMSGPEYQQNQDGGGVFTISSFHVSLYSDQRKVVKTTGNAFRLRCNGKLLAEQAAKPEEAENYYAAEGEFSAECQTGDVLTWTFFCRDESGVGYEFFLREWSVKEDGLAQNAQGVEWPKLTWDETGWRHGFNI